VENSLSDEKNEMFLWIDKKWFGGQKGFLPEMLPVFF
jgi:hypothetical protein